MATGAGSSAKASSASISSCRDRCEDTTLHHQNDLEQRATERRGFHVAQIALDAGDSQRKCSAIPTEGFRNGVSFNAVTHHGAGRMGLNVVENLRGTSRTGAGPAHQLYLGMTGRRRDVTPLSQTGSAVGGAGLIDGGRLHHGVDVVPVSFGGLQRLDCKDEGSFRAHVAIGFRIEGMTPAIRTDDTQSIEGSTHPGCTQIVGGPDQGLLAVPTVECVHRRVQSGQAGGTSRAVGG